MSEFNVTVKKTGAADRECRVSDDNGAFDTAPEAQLIQRTCVSSADRNDSAARSQYQFVIGNQTYSYQDLVDIKNQRPNARPFPTAPAAEATPAPAAAASPAADTPPPAPAPAPEAAPAPAAPRRPLARPLGPGEATPPPARRAIGGELSLSAGAVIGIGDDNGHPGDREALSFTVEIPIGQRDYFVRTGAGLETFGLGRDFETPGGERGRSELRHTLGGRFELAAGLRFGRNRQFSASLGTALGISLLRTPSNDVEPVPQMTECPDGQGRRTCDLSQSGSRTVVTGRRGAFDEATGAAQDADGGIVTTVDLPRVRLAWDVSRAISLGASAAIQNVSYNPNDGGGGDFWAINAALEAAYRFDLFGGTPAAARPSARRSSEIIRELGEPEAAAAPQATIDPASVQQLSGTVTISRGGINIVMNMEDGIHRQGSTDPLRIARITQLSPATKLRYQIHGGDVGEIDFLAVAQMDQPVNLEIPADKISSLAPGDHFIILTTDQNEVIGSVKFRVVSPVAQFTAEPQMDRTSYRRSQRDEAFVIVNVDRDVTGATISVNGQPMRTFDGRLSASGLNRIQIRDVAIGTDPKQWVNNSRRCPAGSYPVAITIPGGETKTIQLVIQ